MNRGFFSLQILRDEAFFADAAGNEGQQSKDDRADGHGGELRAEVQKIGSVKR